MPYVPGSLPIVHLALAAYPEDILEGNYLCVGDRHGGEADQLPIQRFITAAKILAQRQTPPGLLSLGVPPLPQKE
jgi:hypothetical protein